MYPLAARCIKQGAVSHRTPEAEIVAGDAGLRTIGIPLLDAYDTVARRRFVCDFREDNQTMIAVCKTGRNPTMRTLKRTHGVAMSWLHESFTSDASLLLTYQETKGQSANILNKALDPCRGSASGR